ncbi:MAG: hypothetical protein NTW04_02600, partial [Elusimicrobia bacterium]|nr:hypothetical protein [Elusimicrobiota bacterium]
MKKIIPLVFLCAVPSHAAIKNWEYCQSLRIDKAAPHSLKLPYETLDKSADGLADIRIFDKDGMEVPYLLALPDEAGRRQFEPAKFISAVEKNKTVISITAGKSGPVDSVIFRTAWRDFIKSVNVSCSADGTIWKEVAHLSPIYRQGGEEKFNVDFDAVQCPYIKAEIDNLGSEPIAITDVSLCGPETIPSQLETISKDASTAWMHGQNQVLHAGLPSKNLYLYDAKIISATPVLSRRISVFTDAGRRRNIASAVIYRFISERNTPVEQLRIPISRALGKASDVFFSVEGGRQESFDVSRIDLRIVPAYIEFYP